MENKEKRLGFKKSVISWTLDKIIIITLLGNFVLWALLATKGQTVGGSTFHWKYNKSGLKFLLSWITAGFVNWFLTAITLGIFWIISLGEWKNTGVWIHEKWFGYHKIFNVI